MTPQPVNPPSHTIGPPPATNERTLVLDDIRVRVVPSIMRSIDLNGDLGESFGRWRLGEEPDLLGHLSSANLACGFHAGDPTAIRRAIRTAADHGVAIGAHPSYPDLRGFGRTAMALPPTVIRDDVLYQLGALQALSRAEGATLRHVKAHGALYHAVAYDPDTAQAFAEAIASFDPGLHVVLPAYAPTRELFDDVGLPTIREAFLDRGYQSDGRLIPRGRPGDLLHDADAVIERALALALGGVVHCHDGVELPLEADTLCLHGDGADAATLARAVRHALESHGVRVAPTGETP